jgi:regulator of sigma E protease
MVFFLILISASFLTIAYYLGYFTLAILLGVHNNHYFLGFGNRLFDFKIKGVLFTVGIFIPIFGLARIYRIEERFKKRPHYAWEFVERPLFKRFLVTYGGVFSIFLSSLLIFIAIAYLVDDRYISKEEINRYGVYPSLLAEQYGFQFGDKILKINGEDFERYDELNDPEIYKNIGNSYTVNRKGEELIIKITALDSAVQLREPFLQIMSPFEIDSVEPNSPAERIGLQKGDRIIKVNERKIYRLRDMQDEFRNDTHGHARLEIQRIENYDTITFSKAVALDQQKRIGVFTREPVQFTTRSNSFLEALIKGTRKTFSSLSGQIRALFMVVAPKPIKGGPIGISSAFGNFSWVRFWYIIATWSSWFILWNFLPYPKSAIWESVALVYERVSKKKYPDSFFRKTLSFGWLIFFAQILWIFVNDISKLFNKKGLHIFNACIF